jgi:hypothetical protein
LKQKKQRIQKPGYKKVGDTVDSLKKMKPNPAKCGVWFFCEPLSLILKMPNLQNYSQPANSISKDYYYFCDN